VGYLQQDCKILSANCNEAFFYFQRRSFRRHGTSYVPKNDRGIFLLFWLFFHGDLTFDLDGGGQAPQYHAMRAAKLPPPESLWWLTENAFTEEDFYRAAVYQHHASNVETDTPCDKDVCKGCPNVLQTHKVIVRAAGGKGDGLFALEAIEKGEWLAEYTGSVVTAKEIQKNRHGAYVITFKDGKSGIDGKCKDSPAHFVNHTCKGANSCFQESLLKRVIFLRTLRRVEGGEEITVDYGPGYNISPCLCSFHAPKRARVSSEEEYARIQKRSKGLSVNQPFALLLALSLKDFEGRSKRIGHLEDGECVWICATATLPAWDDFKASMEEAGVPLDHDTFKAVFGVESITQGNYADIFRVGCVVGRVRMGKPVDRAAYERADFVPVKHTVVYPVSEGEFLRGGPWAAFGVPGSTFQVSGTSVLERNLDSV